eukprot:6060266-Amphidinium_carterae.1
MRARRVESSRIGVKSLLCMALGLLPQAMAEKEIVGQLLEESRTFQVAGIVMLTIGVVFLMGIAVVTGWLLHGWTDKTKEKEIQTRSVAVQAQTTSRSVEVQAQTTYTAVRGSVNPRFAPLGEFSTGAFIDAPE